jgi:hypothetical protein
MRVIKRRRSSTSLITNKELISFPNLLRLMLPIILCKVGKAPKVKVKAVGTKRRILLIDLLLSP